MSEVVTFTGDDEADLVAQVADWIRRHPLRPDFVAPPIQPYKPIFSDINEYHRYHTHRILSLLREKA